MDVCDRAQRLEEAARAAALSKRQRDITQAVPTGDCLNCGESVGLSNRFCDQDCRDDYQRLQAKAENDRILRGLR